MEEKMSASEELIFDATYCLEVLLFTSIIVFSVILCILIVLLYAPRLRRLAFRYHSISGGSTMGSRPRLFRNAGSVSSRRSSRTTSTDDCDLDSIYLPGQYANHFHFMRPMNPKSLQDPRLIQQRAYQCDGRQDIVINSTYRDDVDRVSLNKYFPGLKELSRISSMSPDDLMVKLQNDYQTYAKMRKTIQNKRNRSKARPVSNNKPKSKTFTVETQEEIVSSRQMSRCKSTLPHKPYTKPDDVLTGVPMKQSTEITEYHKLESTVVQTTESPVKLRSILKKSSSFSDSGSTLNPSFSRPKSQHIMYVV